jgi:transposase
VNQTVSIQEYQELLANFKAVNEQLAKLTYDYNQLLKLLYASRQERFVPESHPEQLSLPFEGIAPEVVTPEPPTESISYTRKKNTNHKGRNPLPEHLPVEEITIEPDMESLEGYKCIGHDITETVDYHPAELIKIRYIRPRYVRIEQAEENEATVVIGALPYRPIPKGIAEAGLLAYLIVAKYVDHLPFYRQIEKFKREHDWNISKSTINDWFAACCTLLEPLFEAYKRHIVNSTYLQADESPIKVLSDEKQGKSHQGYMWVFRNPKDGSVLFDYRPGRGKASLLDILSEFTGLLQCDGYSSYESFVRKRPQVKLMSCLAHIRRKFIEARDNHPTMAEYALKLIQQLYALERQYQEEGLCDEQIAERRNIEARPMFMELLTWVVEQHKNNLSKEAIGAALRYAAHQLPQLEVYLSDGRVKIDNNLIENAIRPLALGRKNYLFCGSHEGAKRAAMMYSFLASCKTSGVNPLAWLKYVLQNLEHYPQKRIHELFPANWKPEENSSH